MTKAFNPFALLKAAASGELEAQRAFTEQALTQVNEGDAIPQATICEGLIFARLAAAHGDMTDHGRLISLFALAALHSTSQLERDVIGGEALAHLNMLADAGQELAGDFVATFTQALSTEAVIIASEFHKLMSAAE